jgi:hypothetical protein
MGMTLPTAAPAPAPAAAPFPAAPIPLPNLTFLTLPATLKVDMRVTFRKDGRLQAFHASLRFRSNAREAITEILKRRVPYDIKYTVFCMKSQIFS